LTVLSQYSCTLLSYSWLLTKTELDDANDVWQYEWSITYSVSEAYKVFQGPAHQSPSFKCLLESSCQKKHKIFWWHLLHNRLNTRAMLQRKNFHLTKYNCIMCGASTLETRDHLFLHCTFASWCWSHLLPDWIIPNTDIHSVLQSFKFTFRQPFFIEVSTLVLWAIYTSYKAKPH
jgi:hypothetical protein